jgi:FkbM family methyltransferase
MTKTHATDFYIESPPWGEPHVFAVGTGAYRAGDTDEIHRTFCRDLYNLRTIRNLHTVRVVMDFGAGIGAFGVACHQVWPEAEIYCFEPDERKYELLCANIHQGGDGWGNVHAFGTGVGYAPELMDIEEVFAHTSENFVDLARFTAPAMEACFPHIETHSAERIDMITGHYRSTFETFERMATLAFAHHTFPRPHPADAGRFTGMMRGH